MKAAFIHLLLEIYYGFQIIILIRCIVKSLKIRYQDINEKLLKIQYNQDIKELQGLTENFRILGESTEIFNLFGYQIIMIILHSGLQLICCINFTFTMIR